MIYCVWYPSGGFGHFVNAVLTLHGENFVRPSNTLEFSPNGNSHNLELVVPKYLHDCWPGGIEFLDNKNYCVLVDNGIGNESKEFKATFPNSRVVKICYSDHSWPVIAKTMIDKAMVSSIEYELPTNEWHTDADWARREKYFLFLRDHKFRYAWKPQDEYVIFVENIYRSYNEFFNAVGSIAPTTDFADLWQQWRSANSQYIGPVVIANNIIDNVMLKKSVDLTHITDIWTQSVIYYYIWIFFGVEVLHNDFADFFESTDQIIKLVT